MKRDSLNVGVVGCGSISDIYLKNMIGRFKNLNVVCCCAAHYENAVKKAEQYHIRPCTFEEMLAAPQIDMVVVLTPTPSHYQLIKDALMAGKHVYTEKTMTGELSQAAELLRLAREKGLYLGAAPDTFLGASLQNARKAIDDGLIGQVTGFQISANRDLNLLASFAKFLRLPGGGISYDYGVYYLTALVSLLGPAAQVCAKFKNQSAIRPNIFPQSPEFGQTYEYPNESQVSAIVELRSGVMGTFCLNGDTAIDDLSVFLVYGSKGILRLGNPNEFGGSVSFLPNRAVVSGGEQKIDYGFDFSDNCRGVGPSEMASAILEGRGARASSELAYHILEIICKMERSSESGMFEAVDSTCRLPEPMAKS